MWQFNDPVIVVPDGETAVFGDSVRVKAGKNCTVRVGCESSLRIHGKSQFSIGFRSGVTVVNDKGETVGSYNWIDYHDWPFTSELVTFHNGQFKRAAYWYRQEEMQSYGQ